jgi:dihydrofolate reductase
MFRNAMRKIVYYVAASLDGFISGPADDISGFNQQGTGVQQYLADLSSFDTVIMGRKTYEFGYKYGMKPGDAPYPNMKHYIFSSTLKLENPENKVTVCKPELSKIKELKAEEGTDIYLCGGGKFAGWLLQHEQIDTLKLKLNPLIQGSGIKLFGDSVKIVRVELTEAMQYDYGLQIITYKIKY